MLLELDEALMELSFFFRKIFRINAYLLLRSVIYWIGPRYRSWYLNIIFYLQTTYQTTNIELKYSSFCTKLFYHLVKSNNLTGTKDKNSRILGFCLKDRCVFAWTLTSGDPPIYIPSTVCLKEQYFCLCHVFGFHCIVGHYNTNMDLK